MKAGLHPEIIDAWIVSKRRDPLACNDSMKIEFEGKIQSLTVDGFTRVPLDNG